jgi:aerobic carbon-monoxide dehydrogenase medium subunit
LDAHEAAAALVGGPLTPESVGRAADLAAGASQPRSDHRGSASYKRHIVRTFTARLLSGLSEPTEKVA